LSIKLFSDSLILFAAGAYFCYNKAFAKAKKGGSNNDR
jgi:hypothetical protein